MTLLTTARSKALTLGAAALCTAVLLTGCGIGGETPKPTNSASATNDLAASIENLIKTGIAQADAGDTDAATNTFNNVLTLDPGNKFAYFNLGVIAQGKGDTAGALDFYNKALATDAKYTPAMFNKAIILEATDINQAIALYEQIVAIDPKAATAFLRLSFAYEQTGQKDKAADARATAIKLDPTLENVTPTPAP